MARFRARLLLPLIAVAVGLAAFAFGYRSPESVGQVAAGLEPKGAAQVRTGESSSVRSSPLSAGDRSGLLVEGFAKIGFPEIEELLTAASPDEREQWARELGALPEQPLKAIAMVAFYAAWLDLEPDGALRSLRDFPDLLNRSRVFSTLISAVPPAVLPEMVDIVSEFTKSERNSLLPSFLATLAETDPLAAARFLDSHPQLVSSYDAEALISAWAMDDVAAAACWLEGSQFSSDPGVLGSLVNRWLENDPTGAQDYVVRHRQTAGIAQAASAVAHHLLATSPGQARDFISLFGDEVGPSVVGAMISSAKDNQVASLAAWASTLSTSVTTSGDIGYALKRWNSLDSSQAIAWLETQPTPKREALVIQMANSGPPPSRELVSLAYKIGNAELRDEALATLASSFGSLEATEQIRALGLSVSQTNHLLQLRAAQESDVEATGHH